MEQQKENKNERKLKSGKTEITGGKEEKLKAAGKEI